MIEITLKVNPIQLLSIAEMMTKDDPVTTTEQVAIILAATEQATTTDPDPVTTTEQATTTTEEPPVTTTEQAALAKGMCGVDIPWDARIHGNTKKTNADGSWRLKNGVDRAVLVHQVEAELIEAMRVNPDDVPAPPSSGPTTFAELLPLVTGARAKGTLTEQQITDMCTELKLANFGLIATRPDLIPQAAKLLGV